MGKVACWSNLSLPLHAFVLSIWAHCFIPPPIHIPGYCTARYVPLTKMSGYATDRRRRNLSLSCRLAGVGPKYGKGTGINKKIMSKREMFNAAPTEVLGMKKLHHCYCIHHRAPRFFLQLTVTGYLLLTQKFSKTLQLLGFCPWQDAIVHCI